MGPPVGRVNTAEPTRCHVTDIDTVLFDLDRTLIRYRRSPGDILQDCFEQLGTGPLFCVEEYFARFDEFAHCSKSIAQLRSRCFAALAVENGYDADLGRDVAAVFDAERDQSNVRFRSGVPELLDSLDGDYRLGIVTNGFEETQGQKIEAVGLEQWIDETVIAGSETPLKPAPEPFERAMDRLQAVPENTVHVGDSLETDVQGAAAAGLRSVWVSAGGDPEGYAPTYMVISVSKLGNPPWES